MKELVKTVFQVEERSVVAMKNPVKAVSWFEYGSGEDSLEMARVILANGMATRDQRTQAAKRINWRIAKFETTKEIVE